MSVKLLTEEHHFEFISAEARRSLHLSNCWKSHATAHIKETTITCQRPASALVVRVFFWAHEERVCH